MRNVELKTNERKTKLIHNQQNSQGRINNYTVKIHKNMLLRQLVIFLTKNMLGSTIYLKK
jgi:hypothetical protein